MALSQAEFEEILADNSKRIAGDIAWVPDHARGSALRFRAAVRSAPSWPLWVVGFWRRDGRKLTYTLIYDSQRIAALDLGATGHTNADGTVVSGDHLHLWSARYAQPEAQTPGLLTARLDEPRGAWALFCAQLGILHLGEMLLPRERA